MILLSNRPDDLKFLSEVPNTPKPRIIASWQDLMSEKLPEKEVVIIDVDHKGSQDLGDPLAIEPTLDAIKKSQPQARIIALSDKSIFQHPPMPIEQLKLFTHNFVRRPGNSLSELVYKNIVCGLINDQDVFGLLFGDNSQRVTITKSEHKLAAVEAVQNFLSKVGIDSMIAAKVAQSADELLMNAIFDAPRNSSGKAFRHNLARTSKFNLEANEVVALNIGRANNLLGVSVEDHFGSISREVVYKFLSADYRKANYRIDPNAVSAGLGLNGIVKSGLSLLMQHKKKAITKVSIIVPICNSVKEMKQSFQFVSFISDT